MEKIRTLSEPTALKGFFLFCRITISGSEVSNRINLLAFRLEDGGKKSSSNGFICGIIAATTKYGE